MFLQLIDRILPFLKSNKQQGKVCPNGHVMHPSWDQCPYCLEMQQAMMAGGGGGGMPMPPAMGQGTAMINLGDVGGGGDKGRGSSDKSRMATSTDVSPWNGGRPVRHS